MCDQAFLGAGTLSHNAWRFRQEFLRFVSKCCAQHPRFSGCTIPHNLQRLMGFSGQAVDKQLWKCFGKREIVGCKAFLQCCATSSLFSDCRISMRQVFDPSTCKSFLFGQKSFRILVKKVEKRTFEPQNTSL